ncbi:S-adenosyl-L-methionine-dependent methyltransferase [Myxozyma melibiosi]|uniref:S-adenosyl-L-methionine-dependent methyltransferase n=1 Tax=Myxozyma melibiosi TaxID=54550 RepID=A0ABR1EZ36_9ASCO
MNLYLDSAQFIDQKTAYATESVNSFSALHARIEAKLSTLKSEPKRIYALLRSTIRYKELLDVVIKESQILKEERRLSYSVAVLLLHDLLISKTGITAGKGPLKDAVLRHKVRLKGEFTKVLVKKGIADLSSFNASANDRQIRWIRVNTVLASALPEILPFSPTTTFPPPPNTIYKDPYIENLYAVANTHTRLILGTQAYKTGALILQDRASCFPAQILAPHPGETVIDSCAAPGNKTTHICALMGGDGSVIAYERDEARAQVLSRMVKRAGAGDMVRVENSDFTRSKPPEMNKVERILCDPSCSGSGIFRKDEFKVSRTKEIEGIEDEQDGVITTNDKEVLASRLFNLAYFQKKIVKHALVDFPNVRRVVYSTCSIHAEENEDVVRGLLTDPDVARLGWRLLKRQDAIPHWERRGWTERFEGIQREGYDVQSPAELADGCVRAEPVADGGIGFFVAGFEKVGEPLEMAPKADRKREHEEKSEEQNEDEEDDVEEWNGFGVDDVVAPIPNSNDSSNESNGKKTKRKNKKKKTA